jgi:hypothetical protein
MTFGSVDSGTLDYVLRSGGTASNLTMQGVTTRQGYEQDSSGVFKRGYDAGGLYVSGQTQTTPSNVVTRQLLPVINGVQAFASTAAGLSSYYGAVSVLATNNGNSVVWQSLCPPSWATALISRIYWAANTNDIGATAVNAIQYFRVDNTNGLSYGYVANNVTNTIQDGVRNAALHVIQPAFTNTHTFAPNFYKRIQIKIAAIADGQTRTNTLYFYHTEFEWQ